MPITTAELARLIVPARCNLLLGAGASIPSGGMSGIQLAKRLALDLSGSENTSGNLAEIASILCMKYGRAAVVAALRQHLQSLTPTGGLLALPTFPWVAIYTTSYDRLIELAYQRHHKPLT